MSICFLFFTFLLTACQITSDSSPEVKESPEAEAVKSSPRINTGSSSASDSTANLLLGRWVSEEDPDTGFEPWAFFYKEKVHSDGNEEGTPYQVQDDTITYDSANGKTTTRIIELTASRFVEESEGGVRTVWTKADL